MYCSQCGKEISDNSKFCNECGCLVAKQNDQRVIEKIYVKETSSKKNTKTRKKLKLWHIVVASAAVMTLIVSCVVLPKVFSQYDWDEVELSSVLPEPESKWGGLSSNTKDYLYLYVHRISLDEYNSYVAECVDKGFNVEAETEDSSYIAFNADGYKLTLYYYQSDKKMTINVDAPIDMQTIQWATSDIAKLLPVPKSAIGNIERNDEKGLSVYLGETSYLEYSAYVNECETNGFTVEFQKQDKYFSAKNADGYQLNVQYKGCNVIYISIIEPQKTLDLSFRSLDSEFEFSVYIDDSWELDVEKGEIKTCNVILGMGEHIIKVESDDDWDVYDNYVLTVTKDEKIKFDVCCTRNGIEIGLSGKMTIEATTNSSKTDNKEKNKDKDKITTENRAQKETNINTIPYTSCDSFNITDKELIDWMNNYSEFEVAYTEIGISSDVNTGYKITMDDGETGVLILNHGNAKYTNGGDLKNQDVCGIMAAFDDMSSSLTIVIWVANHIDSNFSTKDAVSKTVSGETYSKANMTVMYLEDSEVAILAPTTYIAKILE